MLERPLLATGADQRRFVDRERETARVLGALAAERNVLVLGAPGSGRSSLLHHVAWQLERERGIDALVVGGESAGSPAQLLGVLVARIRRLDRTGARGDWLDDLRTLSMPDGPFGEVVQPALTIELIDLLGEAVAERGRPLCLMIDGLEPGVAHAVFGSLRNELWAIADVRWVLAGDVADRVLYLEPPADAFFAALVELDPLRDAEARRLLEVHEAEPAPEDLDAVVLAGAGNPRRLLRAAASARAGAPLPDVDRATRTGRAAEIAGPLAVRLVEYLLDHGFGSASDPRLLRQVGASRQRVSEVLRALEEAGVLESTVRHEPGQAGRPARRFAVRSAT